MSSIMIIFAIRPRNENLDFGGEALKKDIYRSLEKFGVALLFRGVAKLPNSIHCNFQERALNKKRYA